jgi:hypothetical protein
MKEVTSLADLTVQDKYRSRDSLSTLTIHTKITWSLFDYSTLRACGRIVLRQELSTFSNSVPSRRIQCYFSIKREYENRKEKYDYMRRGCISKSQHFQ